MNTAAATNDNQPNVLAPKLFRRELPCRLNADERERYGSMLSSKVRERDMLDDQRKSVAAEYSSKIKSVTTEISRVAIALDKGEELRSIDCYMEFRNGVMHTIRTDTGDTVEVRPATLADRQAELPGANGATHAPTDTDFPDIDAGPSGNEMLPGDPSEADAQEAEERELAAEEAEAGGSLVTSSVGDEVFHQPDDPGGDNLDADLDSAFEERQKAEAANAAASDGEKPKRKRGGKRAPKAGQK